MKNYTSKFKTTTQALAVLLMLHTTSINAKITNIETIQDYQNNITQSSKPILLKFAANWCGSCQSVKEPFEQISIETEFKDITFANIDIDALGPIANDYKITGIPTFIYMKDGKIKKQSVGVKNLMTFKDEVREDIRNNIMNENTIEAPKELEEQLPMPKMEEVNKETQQENTTETQTEPGIMAQIKNTILSLIDVIKESINTLINSVMQLFSK